MDEANDPLREAGLPVHPERMALLVSVATGAAAGAALGVFGAMGLAGVIGGAIVGAVGGAGIAVYVQARSKRQRAR